MSAQSPHCTDDVEVWDEAPYIIILTREAIHVKKFDTIGGREKAIDSIGSGADPKSSLGMMTRTVPFNALRTAAVVPDMGVLVVYGSRLKDPIRIQMINPTTARRIFDRLRERLKESQGGRWEVQSAKASANDVPFDPQLGVAVFFGLVAILGLVIGAIEGVPNQGLAIAVALAWLGNALGKVWSFLLAGAALAAAIYFCVRWIKALPPKLFTQRD